MGISMEYEGPTAEDLVNIRALNAAFLGATNHAERTVTGGVSHGPLSDVEIQRLSMAPLLLFSLREEDTEYWDHVLADDTQGSLLPATDPPDDAILQLQAAGLGFLWQLSRRNAYTARLVCGAPAKWCDRLARTTLVALLRRTASRGDLIVPRFRTQDHVGLRLLQSSVSEHPERQQMSRQLALQAMHTRSRPVHYQRLAAAACAFSAPLQRVVDSKPAKARKGKV